jgi:hypothetical protein
VGLLPALIARQSGGARWLKVASPRMERQELPVQRNSTFIIKILFEWMYGFKLEITVNDQNQKLSDCYNLRL